MQSKKINRYREYCTLATIYGLDLTRYDVNLLTSNINLNLLTSNVNLSRSTSDLNRSTHLLH